MADAILFYDAECGFCRWSLDVILRGDRRGAIRAVPLQSGEADAALGHMDRDQKMASWHLVTADGRIVSAGAAIPELARRIHGGRPVAAFAALAPKTADRLYRLVARNRGFLGRALRVEACAADPSDTGHKP